MSMLHERMDDPKDWVSRTKQSFREESDINSIVAKARRGQAVTHVARSLPVFMDVSEVGDYRTALDMLRQTDEFFSRLPAKVRAVFNNDPAEFLDGLDTVEGRSKLEKAGLVPPIPDTVNPAGIARRGPDGRFTEDVPPGGGTE